MSKERLIVVATEDACGFDGEVSSQFGSCPFFLLAETNGTIVTVSTVVPNPGFETHRPGAVPRFLYEMGANVIIAGGASRRGRWHLARRRRGPPLDHHARHGGDHRAGRARVLSLRALTQIQNLRHRATN
jgi:hypothetical protein